MNTNTSPVFCNVPSSLPWLVQCGQRTRFASFVIPPIVNQWSFAGLFFLANFLASLACCFSDFAAFFLHLFRHRLAYFLFCFFVERHLTTFWAELFELQSLCAVFRTICCIVACKTFFTRKNNFSRLFCHYEKLLQSLDYNST